MNRRNFHSGWLKGALAFFVVAAALVATVPQASAQKVLDQAPELKEVGVKENLGNLVPMDLTFQDETGKQVKLADYFNHGKPVLVTLAYYKCPMLCTLVLNGLSEAIAKLGWQSGEHYEILTVSIDPRDTPQIAAEKRQAYLDTLKGKVKPEAWHFLTAEASQSQALADALGFQYVFDKETKEYAHPAVTHVLTEKGKISRYFYGISYKPRDLRLALTEAADGKIGTTLDRLMLYCYRYDPEARGYVMIAERVMKIGGGMAVLLIAGFLAMLWRRDGGKGAEVVEFRKAGGKK